MLLGASRSALADEEVPVEVQAQRLEHTLTYLAADYTGAAPNGLVADEDEHDEHLKLVKQAEQIAARLPAPPHLAERVADIGARIRRVAPVPEVEAAVGELRIAIIGSYRIAEAPAAQPNLLRGRALYEEHCATCHGMTGHADTARAASLKPHPADFLDPRIGEPLSPYRIGTTVRFGIEGTAMIPFTFLGDAERWDLAFYVMGLRHAGTPPDDDARTYTVSELARLSDADLRDDLRATGVDEPRVESALADLRRRAAYDDRPRADALVIARTRLEETRTALGRGTWEEAHAAAVAARAEGFRPIAVALDGLDPALARDLDDALTAVRAQVDADAAPSEAYPTIAAAQRAVSRAQRAIRRAYGRRSATASALSSASTFLRSALAPGLLIAAFVRALSRAGRRDQRQAVLFASVGALALAFAAWIAARALAAIPGAGRDAALGAMALAAACGAVLVASSLPRREDGEPAVGVLRAPTTGRAASACVAACVLLAAGSGAFAIATFFPSLLACDVAPLPIAAGIVGGAATVALLALAFARVEASLPPERAIRVSRYAALGLGLLVGGQGMASIRDARAAAAAAHAPEPAPTVPLRPTAPRVAKPAVAAPNPCSDPGYGPAPDVHPVAGAPAFVVAHSCIWPSRDRVELAVTLKPQTKPPTRVQIEALLEGLWGQLETAMRDGFPSMVEICVSAAATDRPDDKPLGCLKKGFEREGEPEGAEDERVDLHIEMAADPSPYGRKSPLKLSPGIIPFRVLSYRLERGGIHQELRARLALTRPIDPPHRDQLEALLKDLANQVRPPNSSEPAEIEVLVYQPDNAQLVASLVDDEGEGATPQIVLPFTFEQAIAAAIDASTFKGKQRPRVDVDEPKKRARIIVPYVDPNTGDWAADISYGAAMRVVVHDVTAVFRDAAALRRLTFTLTFRDRAMVRLELDRDELAALDLEGAAARIASHPFAEQEAISRTEYTTALSTLPPDRARIDPSLK